ncbi:MAG TPA: SDR family oxidoreductase [Pseudonocardiaceae bacterium]|jgi:NAD(P)-dependent dehydrogenase (short-subunit alcohol dehydrogenase family)
MDGQVCVVTGVTAGIGKVTAARLAERGATVVGVARDAARGAAAVEEIRRGGGRMEVLTADLSELAEVRRLATEIAERYDRVHVLINNAGVVKVRRETTVDGLETTFATNHLAPFLLTNLLRDRLVAGAPARVVTVASSVHSRIREIPWDNLQGEHRYDGNTAYSLSKLLNILFTNELARRLDGTGVTANSVHPGFLRTELAREAAGFYKVFFTVVRPFQKGPEAGADTVVYAATAPELATVTGRYIADHAPIEPTTLARDGVAAQRLWQLSARLCGLED